MRNSGRSLTIPPKRDQVEVSIFGPGIGECIVLHLSDNNWAIIDSCRDKETGTPVAIRYLKDLQVDLSSSVKLFVVTHWDDDHIRGASETLEMCFNARFSCSAALLTDEFIQLVRVYSEKSLMISSGADEFARIIQMLVDRAGGTRKYSAGPVWAKAETVLLEMDKEDHRFNIKMRALSPSDGALTLALNEIAQLMPKENVPRRRAVAQKANHVSVALWVTVGESHILLGADLENHPNKDVGWKAVVLKHNPKERATIIKVPHHGSHDAYALADHGCYTRSDRPFNPFRKWSATSAVRIRCKKNSKAHFSNLLHRQRIGLAPTQKEFICRKNHTRNCPNSPSRKWTNGARPSEILS